MYTKLLKNTENIKINKTLRVNVNNFFNILYKFQLIV